MNQDTRKKIAKAIESQMDEGKIFLAPWDERRIAWEGTVLSYLHSENRARFDEILKKACEGTGCCIELISSVEGHIYEL